MNIFRLKRSNSTNQKSNGRALLLVGLVLACFGLSQTSLAQLPSPTPDGGYPIANTAEGEGALSSVTVSIYPPTGFANTALGYQALHTSTTGNGNTATGAVALQSNETGSDNTATGLGALQGNTTGDNNTAVGENALANNTVGPGNTAVGWNALSSNTGNGNNTAVGASALGNADGGGNTALGVNAGVNLTTGVNNIDIGFDVVGVAGEANTIRLGTQGTQKATYIAGISGTALGGGVAVRVNASGQLGTVPSSERFKQNIKPMDKASEAILALKPVTFRYKQEIDQEGIPQFGLVAEEVEKVNPDLVARDDKGKIYTVRYEAVNAMLLNEFLKEHRTVQEQNRKIQAQDATITQLKKDMETVVARLKEQDSKIQKVSDQLEVNKPAPQMVLNR
jgi:hypothetical protein